MQAVLHLVKLCVGVKTVAELRAWQTQRQADVGADLPFHITRMRPRRSAEILAGGSLYWVIGGAIQARQKILRLDEVTGEDGIRRCAIYLSRDIQLTRLQPRRAFQGWRYLQASEAPEDALESQSDELSLPLSLAQSLSDIGVR